MLALLLSALGAAERTFADAPTRPGTTVVREIYVSFADLNVLLEGQPRRIMLPRQQYEDLLRKAKKTPEEHAPLAAALVSADTAATVGQDRARLTTTLVADVLEDGLHALPLDLAGVGLRAATLDGKPAAIGRAPGGPPMVFVEGKGRHTLVLDMVAPLQTTAAAQVLTLRLPRPPAAAMHLTVPGDVEIKSGADVASRQVDQAARVTRFELVPRQGETTLVMTLNSHLLRRERVVMASSVVVCEVTQAYERLHARVSLETLHRAVDSFRFAVPEGFQVTEVASPLLARWNVVADGPRRVLEVKLREQTTETVLLNVTAERSPARLDGWTASRLVPLDVVGQVTVVGLLFEDRLQARSIQTKGLVPIDTDVPMRKALPESILHPAPGTPLLRPVVACYAPQAQFELAAEFGRLPAEVAVTTGMLLLLGDRRQEVDGAFTLRPEVEKLFAAEFSVPAGWQVDRVTGGDERSLEFERYGVAGGSGRVRVRFAQGVAPGREQQVRFHAQSTPAGWLDAWQSRPVEFPVFALAGAARDTGAIAVASKDDIAVRLEDQKGLVPLEEKDKKRFRLRGDSTTLAYRYEGQPYKASLVARRTQPRVTARTFSFLRVAPDVLTAHYELIYTIEEARAQQLALLLPAAAPTALSIRALDGVMLKEYDSKKAGAQTRWNVLLAEPRRGTVRLAVDFQQPLSVENAKQVVLPLVRADGVAYQSGLVAVEGDAELDVQVTTAARRVDVGELVDAEYQPGRRLLGAYRFVGEAPEVKIAVTRQPAHPLYPAIVQNAKLVTLLSAGGVSQTSALFELRTKALFLEVKLPAGSTLWSAELDGKPIKPQQQTRQQEKVVLVSLPAAASGGLRSLRLVYETPVHSVGMTGRVELPAPELALRAEAGAAARAEKVPLADLQWHLALPSGYELVRSTGTVMPIRRDEPEPAAISLAKRLYALAGGVPGPTYLAAPMMGLDSSESMSEPESATATLRIASFRPSIMFRTDAGSDFQVYKAAQQQYVKSRFVLIAALRKPDIAQLSSVRQQADPVAWLARNLEVNRPGNAEIMHISLSGVPPREAAALVNAVTDAYMEEVVDVDRKQRGERLSELDKIRTEKETELRRKRTRLKQLVEQVGAGKADSLSLQQQARVQQFAALRSETTALESRRLRAKAEIAQSRQRAEQAERAGDADEAQRLRESINQMTVAQAVVQEQLKQTKRAEEQARMDARTLGGSSIDIEMQRADIAQIEAVLKNVGDERAKMDIELRSKPRVSVIQRAAVPGLSARRRQPAAGYFEFTGSEETAKSTASEGDMEAPAAKKSDATVRSETRSADMPDHERVAEQGEATKALETKVPPGERSFPVADLVTPEKAPTTPSPGSGRQLGVKWQLEDLRGVRSLKIELGERVDRPEEAGTVVAFQSLGEEPVLAVTLANRPRLETLGWALALAVALLGVLLTRRSVAAKARYVLAVAVVATLVPVVPGCAVTAAPANMAFYAASLLVPYYLAAGFVRWLLRVVCGKCCAGSACRASAAAGAALVLAVCMVPAVRAAEPPAVKLGPYRIQLVEPAAPVTVPEDAVVLPYDPDSATGVRDAKQMLVPYSKYVDLWNRAYPDKKLEAKAPPAPYALAGASYTTRLAGDEYLLVEGRLAIDAYADGYVSVPLGLEGGVLARAELDGKPAQISVAQPGPGVNAPNATAQTQKQQAAPPARLVVLQVPGKGRHELVLSVRLRLHRQGGWRVAEGVLPTAPAAALAIAVPDAQTEVRLSRIDDRQSYDTERPAQVIDTALGAGGAVGIQWRPKVTQGQVDLGLTAAGDATLDVQEDGLRSVWRLDLRFPRSRRERFSVGVPAEYLVEKVEGGNVRGWNVRPGQQGQTVEVSLLKPAKDAESFQVQLWRKGPVGTGVLDAFDFPIVSVPDASLQNGRLTIRRSALLDVQAGATSGVKRTDVAVAPAGGQKPGAGPSTEGSVLRLTPFLAYDFVTAPFRIALSAKPVEVHAEAVIESVLKIAEDEQSLESRINMDVSRRPVYRVEVFLPEGLAREQVTARAPFQWAVTEVGKRRLLTVYLAGGQQGRVPVVVSGRLEGTRQGDRVPLPVLEVRGVARQQGTIAVEVDPAVSVEARDLAGCETVLLERVGSWLKPQQRAHTRLALRTRQPDYRGTLVLSLRNPEVACTTVSNVCVTGRAVEETVLLDFTVRKAGIREISFLLPQDMKDARIRAPGLRQKTIGPAGQERPGMVRVRLELQEDLMGQLLVVVQNDRLLEQKREYRAPVPVVETGRTDRRFVTMQSTGRDEVVPGKPRGLEPLARQQKDWKTLEGYGLVGITQAYVATPGAAAPALAFHTRQREVVQTAGARIGLAETLLVMDADGAYRARQVYHVNNRTEQFLQIALPPGSRLWTAWVAGQPVKPTEVPKGTAPAAPGWTPVRIPLVKTAAGDRDYEVRLQYGGRTDPPSNLRKTEFPLVRTVNVKAERSQVRLCLPEQFRWYDFGGTMGRVEGVADLAAQAVEYRNDEARRLVQTLREDRSFAQVRAANNLKQLGMALHNRRDSYRGFAPNAALQEQLDANTSVMREAQQETEKVEAAPQQGAELDNRTQLNALFERQKNTRARNVIQDAGGNFVGDEAVGKAGRRTPGKDALFNDAWLEGNKLANPAQPAPESKPQPGSGRQPDRQGDTRGDRSGGGKQGGGDRIQYESKPQQFQPSDRPQAPQIAHGKLKKQLDELEVQTVDRPHRLEVTDAVTRYQQKLDQAAKQVQLGSGPALPGAHSLLEDVNERNERRDASGPRPAGTRLRSENEDYYTADLDNRSVALLTDGTDSGAATAGGPATAVVPAGMASLDVQLPERGTVFLFTTPGGDVQITARSASDDSLRALLHVGVVLSVLLVAVLVFRMGRRGRPAWLGGRAFSTLLIALGILALLLGFLPKAALVALLAGIAIKIYRFASGKLAGKKPAAQAP